MVCCCWWSWEVFATSCWRDAFVCIACSSVWLLFAQWDFPCGNGLFLQLCPLFCCQNLCLSQGRQSDYFGRTHLALKWLFLMWGIAGRLLGWRDGDWSMFGCWVAFAPNPQCCADKGYIMQLGPRHLGGVIGLCTGFLLGLQSPGNRCIAWTRSRGVLQIVCSQKREVVLLHCVWGRLPICGCKLIKNIAEGHSCIPSALWLVG